MPENTPKSPAKFVEEKDGKMTIAFGQFKGRAVDEVAKEAPVFLRFILHKYKDMPEMQKLVIEQALDNSSASSESDG